MSDRYHPDIREYNEARTPEYRAVCETLADQISRGLPDAESKIWHAHPVWFLAGNPVVGYSKLKDGIRLKVNTGKFKDASIRYNSANEIDTKALSRWLGKARDIQWDYKNIVKRKGVLERLR